MAENKRVENDEIVDSIMGVTLQCGLSVTSIQVEESTINIYIDGAKSVVSFRRSEVPDMTLAELREAIEKQMNE